MEEVKKFPTESKDPVIAKELNDTLIGLVDEYGFGEKEIQRFKGSMWQQCSATWDSLNDERREGYRRWVTDFLESIRRKEALKE